MAAQNERRPRVVFLTTEYPTPENPTAGIFVREHALAAGRRCDVAVVHLHRAPARSGLFEVERVPGELPTLLRVPYRRYPRPLSYVAFASGVLAAIRSLRVAGFDPAVLHANSHLSALAALLAGRVFRRPVAYTEHWSIFLPDNPARLSAPMKLLARFVLGRVTIVLPVSDAMRRALFSIAPRARFAVVPNAVDGEIFHPEAVERARGRPWRLLTVGMLTENRSKGVDVLLEAFALVARTRTDVHLDIVGDGPRRAEYEQLAQRLGVGGLVTFHGLQPKTRVAELMQSADLFVLASRFENNPCVLMEALMTGLPVVASRVGGIPEMVDDSCGLLAEPQNPADLASRVASALDRMPLFDRQTIASSARDRYGSEHVGDMLADIYASCVADA